MHAMMFCVYVDARKVGGVVGRWTGLQVGGNRALWESARLGMHAIRAAGIQSVFYNALPCIPDASMGAKAPPWWLLGRRTDLQD